MGILYVIATPIGNLADFSQRAIECLKESDIILAEDTRHSKILLNYFNIDYYNKKIICFNKDKERLLIDNILEKLTLGYKLALISDAGTPLIQDPGQYLIYKIYEYNLNNINNNINIKIVPIPGACAAITALSVSGFLNNHFYFIGFPPRTESACLTYLEDLKNKDFKAVLIFYESPKRILKFLEYIQKIFGADQLLFIARELTKKFETLYRDRVENLLLIFKQNILSLKGEFVILLENINNIDIKNNNININLEQLLRTLLNTLSLKKTVELAATITDIPKNRLYQFALKIKNYKK